MADELSRALRERVATPGALAGASERLAERAEREGLLDVAYAMVDSPLGPLLAVGTETGLVMLSYAGDDAGGIEQRLARVAAAVSPRILEAPARLDPARRELDEYFERRRRDFDLPIDWALMRGYSRAVLQRTTAIPYGEVRSYAEISAEAGSPRGARATGNALGSNPIPIVIPCHRVLRSGGALGGYTGGTDRKRFLLDLESQL